MIELLISRIKDYVSLNDKDIQIIESLFVKEYYKSNEIVHREGKICNKLWFVAKGLLRFSVNIDGKEQTFVFRNEGCFLSDIESLLKKTPSSKSIITIEDSVLYSISETNLQLLFTELTHGERFGRLLVEEVFVTAVSHIISYYTESPEERYMKFVKYNKTLLQRIPQYHIASFLGIQPQSLCRIKKRQLN